MNTTIKPSKALLEAVLKRLYQEEEIADSEGLLVTLSQQIENVKLQLAEMEIENG